jgi:hypothetical protein
MTIKARCCSVLISTLLALPAAAQPTFTVFAGGLDTPRGLRFSPQGVLYVAEAGSGGASTTTSDQ